MYSAVHKGNSKSPSFSAAFLRKKDWGGHNGRTKEKTSTTANSPLDRTVPGYYYTSTDWSGCGNSTDSTKEMYRKYMIDSIVYWATEYHLDGFRFDLMGVHDVKTMNEIRAALNKVDPQIKMWGEPWCGDGLFTDG